VAVHSIDSRSGQPNSKYEKSSKISIITDVADTRSIPREIRAIVRDERRILRDFSHWLKSKDDADACLVWADGDRLLEGNPRDILKRLRSADRRSFVLVNFPCVDQVPFLTIQPRIFTGAASRDYWSFQIRIENVATSTNRIWVDRSKPLEPWAKLQEAISAEIGKLGSGVELLLGLWESRDKLPNTVGALVPRNLAAAMLLHKEFAQARVFLEAGTKLYPTYAELQYLAALLAVREHRFAEAVPLLERAKSCGLAIPGSGGENSYRCDWLLGVVAAHVGDDRAAFERFLAGLQCNSPFEPSLTELLKLRLPRSLIERNQHVFTRAARWNPLLARRIFEYLLTHHAFDAARLIARTVQLDPEERERIESQLARYAVPAQEAVSPGVNRRNCGGHSEQVPGVALEGPFFEHSSLARVNRAIARGLLSSTEFEVRLEPSAPAALPPHMLPDGKTLVPAIHRRLHHADLTIRHYWPPDFRRPSTGKLAMILPWEFWGVPRVWIEQIQRNIDELWVPSNFVREVFVRNGVDAERIAVIPNGYDPRVFTPEGPSLRPQGCRGFIFLFVGGAIPRKGIDLLLEAYESAFKASQDVTLVLLMSDPNGAYQHNSRFAEIKTAATNPERRHILPMSETLSDLALAQLYRGADAFVLPYRGEGFGMPLLEAMACGKPVITTAEGPAKDFCNAANSYLIQATSEPVPDQPPPLGPMASPFAWFEPSLPQLVKTLRHVYENRDESAEHGRAAALSIRHLTWQNIANQYVARIRHLCKSGE